MQVQTNFIQPWKYIIKYWIFSEIWNLMNWGVQVTCNGMELNLATTIIDSMEATGI